MKHMPELFEVQKIALLNGALMSTLSGSGSTMLSICLNEDSNKLTTILKEKFPHFKVLSVDFDNVGVRVEL